MKRNKLYPLAITAILTGSVLAGGVALAKDKNHCDRGKTGHHGYGMHGGMKHGGHKMGMLRGLDLSAEQKKAMIDIEEKYEEDFKAAHEQMRASRKALHEAMHSGAVANSDELAAVVEPAAEAQAQAMKKMVMLRAQQKSEVHNLLTDEQRATLEQRHEKIRQHHEQKRADREEG